MVPRRVLIAENSEPFLLALLELLHAVPGLEIAAVVRDCAGVIARARMSVPDLYLLDFHLEDGNILGLLESRLIDVETCIVMTAAPSPGLRERVSALGVAAFYDKAEMGGFVRWICEWASSPDSSPAFPGR